MKILVTDPLCSNGEKLLSKVEVKGDTFIFILKDDGTVLYTDTAVGSMWKVATPDEIKLNLGEGHQAIVNAELAG